MRALARKTYRKDIQLAGCHAAFEVAGDFPHLTYNVESVLFGVRKRCVWRRQRKPLAARMGTLHRVEVQKHP